MDELERLRRLADDAPAPDPARKAEARRELLDLAERERRGADDSSGGERTVVPWAERGRRGRWSRPGMALAAAAVVLLLAGVATLFVDGPGEVGGRGDRPGDPDGSGELRGAGTEGADVRLAASCAGPEGRYEVRYPAGWHTDPGRGCSIFGEEPVEESTGGPGVGAVAIDVAPVALDVATDPSGVRVLSTERVTVAGRPALRRLEEGTGEAVLPKGVRRYSYFLDLGDAVLVASTTGPPERGEAGGDAGFERRRRVLDAMMATLELRDG